MQSLQCFTNSLHDHASLQRLRDNLQDLPKRLLSRHDQQEDYLLGSVTGECNYHFKFRLEGGGFFQTGVLVASAEKAPGGLPVPLKCRWKRRVGDLPVEIPGVTSNMYQISADDVGTEICVEAQPADVDDGLHGVVVGEIGPFELDPATRRSLDNALGLGGSRFTVTQPRSPSDQNAAAAARQDLVIHVSAEGVRVVPVQAGSERSGKDVAVEYSADYPKVIIHPLDTTKFQLIMGESKTFHLVATSRTSRDLIALTIRCFHSKKYLSTENILETLLPVRPLVPGSHAPVADSRLDACILLERLTKELNRAMQQKEVSEKVLRNTKNEKRQLQSQLMETITACTEVIEGLEQNADGFQASAPLPLDLLQEQLREATSHNQLSQQELQQLRQQLSKLQQARRAAENVAGGAAAAPSLQDQARQLLEERNLLQVRLAEVSLSSGTQQRDQADHVHAQELKRLRQDVETLHSQKEQLRQQLQDQDREREEMTQSFLYVKRQLDKVQMRQANAASSSEGDGERELQRQREVIDTVEEERSRLSKRVEAVLREAEKEKAYHEQSLERVMAANARLMEERDRASAEVQRLSRLYADSVQQLRGTEPLSLTTTGISLAGRSGLVPDTSPGGQEEAEELGELRTAMAQVEDALQRREQENESLKNRIRKLAVA